jgi:hypothetical protein
VRSAIPRRTESEASRYGNGGYRTREPVDALRSSMARCAATSDLSGDGIEPDRALRASGRAAPAVRASPLANSVTSWPSVTRESVTYATTRSVPPYSDGGTDSANGAIWAIFNGSPLQATHVRLRTRQVVATPQLTGYPRAALPVHSDFVVSIRLPWRGAEESVSADVIVVPSTPPSGRFTPTVDSAALRRAHTSFTPQNAAGSFKTQYSCFASTDAMSFTRVADPTRQCQVPRPPFRATPGS